MLISNGGVSKLRPSFVFFSFYAIIVQSLFRKVHLTVDHLYMKKYPLKANIFRLGT